MRLKKDFLYKIVHKDICVGQAYGSDDGIDGGWKALSNHIIFSPNIDMDITEMQLFSIPCDFLITFDNLLIEDGQTNYSHRHGTIFEEIKLEDIRLIVNLFKQRNKLFYLSKILLNTQFRYNRKTDNILTLNSIKNENN